MKSIFNLVLFLSIICIIVILCNHLTKENQNQPIIKNENFVEGNTNQTKNIPKGNPTISFNYEVLPKVEEKEFNLEEVFNKELKSGATVHPQYTNDKFEDQKVIHDNRMYEKPIHRYRTLETNDNELPKTIGQIFDQSITDFKKLTPIKKGNAGEFASDGGFNLASYNPDFIGYDDEKPENGGIIPGLYGEVYGHDPLLENGNALF
jgi:hypothetical protein